MNIDDMKVGEVKQLAAMFGGGQADVLQPFTIGKAYLIRTVTHIDIGIVEAVGDKEIVMSQVSWISSTGRFHDALMTGKLDEVEPYPDGEQVILGRGSIIDATAWNHELPRNQK